jgi:hypothetical protein
VAWEKILVEPTVVPAVAGLDAFLNGPLASKVLVPEDFEIPASVESSFQRVPQPLSSASSGGI